MTQPTYEEMMLAAYKATVRPLRTPRSIEEYEGDYVDTQRTASVAACHILAFSDELRTYYSALEDRFNKSSTSAEEKDSLHEESIRLALMINTLMMAFSVTVMQSSDIPVQKFTGLVLSNNWHICVLREELLASNLIIGEDKQDDQQDFFNLTLPAGALVN